MITEKKLGRPFSWLTAVRIIWFLFALGIGVTLCAISTWLTILGIGVLAQLAR